MVTPDQWSSFCSTSFDEDGGYQSYVTELATISSSFIEWMSRTNKNGVNALRILQNASSRSHYEYLQNSSRLLLQLHYEFKTWMRNVRMSHITRLYIYIRVFVFCKLVTHSSACYSPTLIQTTQSRLIHLIASEIRYNGLFQAPIHNPSTHKINGLAGLNKPHIIFSPGIAEKRLKKRDLERKMWSKKKKVTRVKHSHKTNIFKRPRAPISMK